MKVPPMHIHEADTAVSISKDIQPHEETSPSPILPPKRQVIAVVNTVSAFPTAVFLERKDH